jgi:alpha-tubulin suppressor-like RCC1 family protein
LGKQYIEDNIKPALAASTQKFVSFGSNANGLLGNGTDSNIYDLSPVSNVTNITQVSQGFQHTLGRKADGTVWAWGSNGYSQLGQTTSGAFSTPVQVPGLTGVTKVIAGRNSSFALKSDGTLWQWGSVSSIGTFGVPTQVTGLPSTIVDFDVNTASYYAITNTGGLYVWGNNGLFQLGLGNYNAVTAPTLNPYISNIAELTTDLGENSGLNSQIVRKTDGTLWAWGDRAPYFTNCSATETYTSVGISAHCKSPAQVTDAGDPSGFVTGIASFSGATSYNGQIYGVKNNTIIAIPQNQNARAVFAPFSGLNIVRIVSKDSSLASLTSTNRVYTSGINNYGQLAQGAGAVSGGVGNNATATLLPQTGISDVDITDNNIVVATNSGIAYGAGDNGNRQVGNNLSASNALTPQDVASINLPAASIQQIEAGSNFAMVLKTDGTVWAWGRNDNGQLGIGSNLVRSTVPAQVVALTGITKIVTNREGTTAIALKNDGTAWVWGYNGYSQLGNGTNVNSNMPIQYGNFTNVIQIAASFNTLGVVLSDNTTRISGQNGVGLIGDGTNVDKNVPTANGLTGVANLFLNGDNSFYLKTNNEMWTSGYSAYPTTSNVPLLMASPNTITSSPATLSGCGSIYCWIREADGKIDLLNYYQGGLNVPLAIQSTGYVGTVLADATPAFYHQLFRFTDTNGKYQTRGYNQLGQNGNGTNTDANQGDALNLESVTKIGGNIYTSYGVGAIVDTILPSQVAAVTFSCPSALVSITVTCTFTLPPNASLANDFKLGIGNAIPGGSCSQNSTNYLTNIIVTCTGVPTGTQAGNVPIFGQFGSSAVINTGETTTISPGPFSSPNDIPVFAALTGMTCTPEPVTVNATISCTGQLPAYINQPTGALKMSISDGASATCTFVSSGSFACNSMSSGTVAGTFPYKLAVGSDTPASIDKTNIVNPTIITNSNISLTGASCKDQVQILGTTFNCTIPLIGSTAYAKPPGGVSLFTTQGASSVNISTGAGTDNCTVNGTNLECTGISTTAETGSTFAIGTANLRSRVGASVATDQTIAAVTFVSNLDTASLASLTYSCLPASINTNTTCTFTLPTNITLPAGFSIQIGATGTPSTACTAAAQLVTCTGVSTGAQTGATDIFTKIGTGAAVNTGEKTQVLGIPAADTDNDGLKDTDEVTGGTNPFVADTDGDGMPDGWEVTYGLDPKLATDAALDKDSDGLTNLQEYTIGSDPTKTNSDSTFTTTKDEATNTITDDKEDIDNDGVTNKDEFTKGTDPKNPDSDGDTISDGDEIAVGTDPKVATSKPTVLTDIDGDGISTVDENKAPNSGDANGDSIKDYKQKNVAPIKDPNSTVYVVVESSETCPISNTSFASEQSLGADQNFDYLSGLANYTLTCGSSAVKLTWYNTDVTKTYTLRKYGPETPGNSTKTFYDYPATITKATVAGASVIQATLNLTDGQKGDSTATDGKIVDPVGLAVAIPKVVAPATPITPATLIRSGGFTLAGLLGLLMIVGTTYLVNSKKKIVEKSKVSKS